MNWDQVVKSRPAPYRGDFRVYVALDSFYNYEFEDSDKYQSFKLTALNSEEVIHGYVVRGSEAFRVIELSLKQNGNKKVPMLLRLNLQEGLQSKSGVLIEDVVAPRLKSDVRNSTKNHEVVCFENHRRGEPIFCVSIRDCSCASEQRIGVDEEQVQRVGAG
jgi:hypothetical protein